jgi:hypothetical protein
MNRVFFIASRPQNIFLGKGPFGPVIVATTWASQVELSKLRASFAGAVRAKLCRLREKMDNHLDINIFLVM